MDGWGSRGLSWVVINGTAKIRVNKGGWVVDIHPSITRGWVVGCFIRQDARQLEGGGQTDKWSNAQSRGSSSALIWCSFLFSWKPSSKLNGKSKQKNERINKRRTGLQFGCFLRNSISKEWHKVRGWWRGGVACSGTKRTTGVVVYGTFPVLRGRIHNEKHQ